MRIIANSITKSLNKAYLKQDVTKNDFERFTNALSTFFKSINYYESEEYQKNTISDFLKNAIYNNKNLINTKGRIDLAIYNGLTVNDTIGVLIEVKSTSNKNEMISIAKPNVKALQEAISYYLEQTITHHNKDVKHIIITNTEEWFIFDGAEFDGAFYKNSGLAEKFTNHRGGLFGAHTTDYFYNYLRDEIIPKLGEFNCTYFNINDYKDIANDPAKVDKLIELYKILSPEHLLKKPFANDSNTLDTQFYDELLHLLGLEETKDSGKKILKRLPEEKRNEGSFLENTIQTLKVNNSLSRIPNINEFGQTEEEQYFSVGLELCITWLNRILFLKLLESQLIKYHNNDYNYKFLSINKVTDFDDLTELFFEVLAVKVENRTKTVLARYANIPYLNSSLFEMTELEQNTIIISALKDRHLLPISGKSVLKSINGEKRTGNLKFHNYLFEFLDSYNFSSDSKASIQETEKTIINSSVLGLIFEKLNGYKDGSIYTPGFITMYMCREAITKVVINKFNENYNWNCNSLIEIGYNLIKKEDKIREYNNVINSIRVIDPAVGSGHFLVSALNEFLYIKSQLGILIDKKGKKLNDFKFYIENDELIVIDNDDEENNNKEDKIFHYLSPFNVSGAKRDKLQRVQETLFYEKQTIIENCLFGVDINPKSVAIARLRLWIELLKNMYYKTNEHNEWELETLPNIDINIKCGNSLVSRFSLDDKSITRGDAKIIPLYKNAVQKYKNIKNTPDKRKIILEIENYKTQLKGLFILTSNKMFQLADKEAELKKFIGQRDLFHESKTKKEKTEFVKTVEKLTAEIEKLKKEVDEIKNNPVYQNAFEWRFEFPEVLDNQGNFVGFDLVIGNPPYVEYREIDSSINEILKPFKTNLNSPRPNLYQFFIEIAYNIARFKGHICYINPNQFLSIDAGYGIRKLIVENTIIQSIDDVSYLNVFESAATYTVVWSFKKKQNGNYPVKINKCKTVEDLGKSGLTVRKDDIIANGKYLIIANTNQLIINKIEKNKTQLDDLVEMVWGTSASGYGKLKIKKEDYEKLSNNEKIEYAPILQTRDIKRYYIKWAGEYIPKSIFSNNIKIKFAVEEKILIARMTLQLQASFDYEQRFVGKSTILTQKSKIGLKYILAILNSNLIDFWYKNYFENTHLSGGYIRFDIPYLKKIPVHIPSVNEFISIVPLVDIILAKKENNEDTSKEEKEIDMMIYKLYDLTEEEIKIVEGG